MAARWEFTMDHWDTRPGKATKNYGKSPFFMGKSPFLMGQSPFLMRKTHYFYDHFQVRKL